MDTEDYLEVELGEEARRYISELLADGKRLGQLVRESVDLSEGRVTTLLASHVSAEEALSFNDGYKSCPEASRDYLLSVVEKLPAVERSRTWVLEDILALRSDPIIRSHEREFCIAFLGDDVYHLASTPGDDYATIKKAMRFAHACWYFLAVVTPLPRPQFDPATGNVLQVSFLEEAARTAEVVAVTAYDGEGLLVWRRGRRKGGRTLFSI